MRVNWWEGWVPSRVITDLLFHTLAHALYPPPPPPRRSARCCTSTQAVSDPVTLEPLLRACVTAGVVRLVQLFATLLAKSMSQPRALIGVATVCCRLFTDVHRCDASMPALLDIVVHAVPHDVSAVYSATYLLACAAVGGAHGHHPTYTLPFHTNWFNNGLTPASPFALQTLAGLAMTSIDSAARLMADPSRVQYLCAVARERTGNLGTRVLAILALVFCAHSARTLLTIPDMRIITTTICHDEVLLTLLDALKTSDSGCHVTAAVALLRLLDDHPETIVRLEVGGAWTAIAAAGRIATSCDATATGPVFVGGVIVGELLSAVALIMDKLLTHAVANVVVPIDDAAVWRSVFGTLADTDPGSRPQAIVSALQRWEDVITNTSSYATSVVVSA